ALVAPPAGKIVGCLVFLTNHEVNRTHHGTAVQNAALAARTTKASKTSLALRVRAVNVRGAKDLAAGPPERLAARGVGGAREDEQEIGEPVQVDGDERIH